MLFIGASQLEFKSAMTGTSGWFAAKLSTLREAVPNGRFSALITGSPIHRATSALPN